MEGGIVEKTRMQLDSIVQKRYWIPTLICKIIERDDANDEHQHKYHKLAMVIEAYAVPNPWAMTGQSQSEDDHAPEGKRTDHCGRYTGHIFDNALIAVAYEPCIVYRTFDHLVYPRKQDLL